MFRSQGPPRSERQNRLLAGYLALIGGYVNSVGFVLIGTFTSHVTGNVGRLANDVASRHLDAAATAFVMIAAFMAGAFVASMSIESSFFGRPARAYGVALSCEATLLAVFTLVASLTPGTHPRLKDMDAALLCAAMGMQNSLVTRLSKAVVRTTHLTGVLTDIGIEGARWFRWWRGRLSVALSVPLAFGRTPSERPSPEKVALLMTIALAFTLGALFGSVMGVAFGRPAMIFPTFAVGGLAAYAFATSGRDGRESLAPGPETRR